MAFGFPAHHEEEFEVPPGTGWDPIYAAFKEAGFSMGAHPDAGTLTGSTSMNLSSWGENLRVTWHGAARFSFRSECSLPTQCIDWGRNKRNVQLFREVVERLLGNSGGFSAPHSQG